MKTKISVLVVSMLLSALCLAQQSQGTFGAGAGGGNANTHMQRPFNDQMNNLATPLNLNQWGAGAQKDYFGGNVVVEGAEIPPIDAVIVITCDHKERRRTTTDVKGNFFIRSYIDDATKKPMDSPSTFVGCEVTASSQGFQSDKVTVQQGSITDSPNVGTIHLHRTQGETPTFFSGTSSSAPKDAIKAYNSALAETKPDLAIRDFQKAVQIDPQYAQAWYSLGKYQQATAPEEAKKSYAKAVAADASFVLPYIQLAGIANQQQKWQEVADNSQHIIELCPKDCPLGWYYSSSANYYLKKYDVAEKSARQGLAVDTLHSVPLLEQSMAVILAHNQQFPEAAEHLRTYLQLAPDSPEAPTVRAQLAQVEGIIAQIKSGK